MHALVLGEDGVRLEERADPAADDETAIVQVALAGVCNTDLELARGYMGFRGVLGHEFVGSVVDGPEEWAGKRVVGEINFACRRCAACRRGLARHCPTRRVMGILNADGAFAEKVAVPVANLHAVPPGVSDEVAVFAEPLAAAFEILEQVDVSPGMEAVILGDGKLGLLAAQALAQAGASVCVVGKHTENLAVVSRHGIGTALLGDWDRTVVDLIVEATGTAAGLDLAVSAIRPRGTIVLKSTTAVPSQVDLAPLVINEITVVGSRCGKFAPALAALGKGSIDVRSLISTRRSLADAVNALEVASRPGVLKVLIEPFRPTP